MKLEEFLGPFSTSNFKVYITDKSGDQILLYDREYHDVIIEDFGDCIVTDVDVEDDMILIWATEE